MCNSKGNRDAAGGRQLVKTGAHPIPGSRYVGGYIGVGLEKKERRIITLRSSADMLLSSRY